MSLYAFTERGEVGKVATIMGWSDFIEWANEQPFSQMQHIAQHGYCVRPLLLANQIYTALLEQPPRKDIASTARNLERMARENFDVANFCVSDGSYEATEDEDSDSEDENETPPAPSSKGAASRKGPANQAATGTGKKRSSKSASKNARSPRKPR